MYMSKPKEATKISIEKVCKCLIFKRTPQKLTCKKVEKRNVSTFLKVNGKTSLKEITYQSKIPFHKGKNCKK